MLDEGQRKKHLGMFAWITKKARGSVYERKKEREER